MVSPDESDRRLHRDVRCEGEKAPANDPQGNTFCVLTAGGIGIACKPPNHRGCRDNLNNAVQTKTYESNAARRSAEQQAEDRFGARNGD